MINETTLHYGERSNQQKIAFWALQRLTGRVKMYSVMTTVVERKFVFLSVLIHI